MAVSGTATIGAGSAGLLFSATGSFGIFSSFSSYLSEQAHYGSGSFSTTGSSVLDLKSRLGEFIFSGSDTISAVSGHVTFGASSGIQFVFGKDTVSLFSNASKGVTADQGKAVSELNKFFGQAISKASVAGAQQHFLLPTDLATVAGASSAATPLTHGATSTEHTLSDNTKITVLKINNT